MLISTAAGFGRSLPGLGVATILVLGTACGPAQAQVKPLQWLNRTSDSDKALAAALAVCRSGGEGDVEGLVQFLLTPDGWSKLDSETDYLHTPLPKLRITRVLEALSRVPRPVGEKALIR